MSYPLLQYWGDWRWCLSETLEPSRSPCARRQKTFMMLHTEFAKLARVCSDCRVSPESVYIYREPQLQRQISNFRVPAAAAYRSNDSCCYYTVVILTDTKTVTHRDNLNGTVTIVTSSWARVQTLVVTSTSAHWRVRSEMISDRHGSRAARGLWTRIVPRPGGARVACGPTRRVGADSGGVTESPMA
jgi:hypothetical protein